MNNLKVALVAVCAVVVGGAYFARADIPASAYVQDGLIAQFDAIDNAGMGTHDANAKTWKDLSGNGNDATLNNCYEGCWAAKSLVMNNSLYASFATSFSGSFTVEIICSAPFSGAKSSYNTLFCAKDDAYSIYKNGTSLTYKQGVAGTRPSIANYNGSSVIAKIDGKTVSIGYQGQQFYSTTGTAISSTGNRTWCIGGADSSHALTGEIFAVRIYNRALSPQEIAFNAVLDKIRFGDADPSEVQWPEGYEYDAETKKVYGRIVVDSMGGGTVSVNGGEASSSVSTKLEVGSSVSCQLTATAAKGYRFVKWQGDIGSADPASATIALPGMAANVKAVFLSNAFGSSSYVRRGLIAQWDGIDNGGVGQHVDVAEQGWTDLVGGCVLTTNVLAGGSVVTGGDFVCLKGASLRVYDEGGAATAIAKALCAPSNTVELVGADSTTGNHTWFSVQKTSADVSGKVTLRSEYSESSKVLSVLCRGGSYLSGINLGIEVNKRFTYAALIDTATYGSNFRMYSDGVFKVMKSLTVSALDTTTGGIAFNTTYYAGNPVLPTTSSPTYNAVRIYNCGLRTDEIELNAALDKIRFDYADPEEVLPAGYALDAEAGKISHGVTIRVAAGGTLSVDGSALTEDSIGTEFNGESVERVLTVEPAEGYRFVGWDGDTFAIVEGDVQSPTVKVRSDSPYALTPRFASADLVSYVSSEGTDVSGRGSVELPYRTIGYALENALEGQEIRIAGGLYEESVTNRDDKAGKGAIKFIGSWKGDFSARDLRNCRTIVRPPEAFLTKVPCFLISAYTNRFDGIDMTGGSYGVVDPYGWVFGSIGKTHGGNDSSVIHHEIRHCVLTNNTYALGSGWEGFAVASSLIAKNGTGLFQQADHGTVSYFHNCTFADNTNYALYQNHSYNAAFVTRNCIFVGNGYVLRTTNSGKNFYDSCFGPQVSAYFYDSTKRYTLNGECPFKDPMLDEEYAPREGSPVLQVGPSLAQNATLPVVDDLYGEPWESDGYDLGCIKSEYKKEPIVKYALQYVSMTGNDANEGTTPETARASIQAALDHIAPTGVVRILKGRYTGIANIMDAGVTVEGESRDETVVVSSDKGQFPGLDVKAHNVTIRNLTLENGNAGVYVEQYATADMCMISNCVMRANNCGVTLVGGSNDGTSGGHWTHVSHCWITNNTSHGLNAGSTYRMDNCLIARNSGYGVNGTYGDRYSQSIAVNCTVADNTGAYGVFANESWAGSQAFYDCVFSGHKTGFFRNGVNYSGGVNIYGSVLCNLTNICNTAGAVKIVKDAATIEVDDMQYDTARSRLYWPSESSPALGMAHSRNATLAVKVYESLNGRKLKPKKPYAAGCYQLPATGLLIFVR